MVGNMEAERYQTIAVRSVGEFLGKSAEKQASWESQKKFQSDAWFRGVPDSTYGLCPSYHRFHQANPGINEDDLRDEFLRRSYPLFEGPLPPSHWEWYCLMQHYDLPTRLLDWTESSLVGLFFAAYDYRALKAGIPQGQPLGENEEPSKAAVWMMDPETLNRHSLGEEFAPDWPLLRHDDEHLEEYLSERPGAMTHADGREYRWPSPPIAMMPPCTNPRLTAQRGMFVLFGLDDTPLEQRFDWIDTDGGPRLIKFEIPSDALPEMRSSLRRAGITPVLLFPELPMLSTDILYGWLK